MQDLAEALFQGLRAELTMPYVLLGHSLGGLLAYEVARRVQAAGLRAPQAVMISGSRAPQTPSLRTMSDAEEGRLLGWIADNGGLPREIMQFPGFVAEILRAIRADLRYAEEHVLPDPPRLACPLHVFGGTDDAITPPGISAVVGAGRRRGVQRDHVAGRPLLPAHGPGCDAPVRRRVQNRPSVSIG